MKMEDFRQLNEQELKAKLKTLREELFHSKFKNHSGEFKDTSVFKKLRGDIARAMTVSAEKQKAGVKVEDKGATNG